MSNFINRPYLNDKNFLKQLDYLTVKEISVKITILDFQERFIEEIQGKVSAGQINIDGNSSLRRTGSLTFIPDDNTNDITDIHNIISINKKVRIELGYKNTTNSYTNFNIIWFPLGTFIITKTSISKSTSGVESISIEIQDKMCLLNGTAGGKIPAAVTLDSYESTIKTINKFALADSFITLTLTESPSGILPGDHVVINSLSDPSASIYIDTFRVHEVGVSTVVLEAYDITGSITEIDTSGQLIIPEKKVLIYNIIKEVVNHFGGEDLSRIVISDVPLRTKKIVKWTGDSPLYLNEDKHLSLTADSPLATYQTFDNIGYEFTDLVFPEDLAAEAGQVVTDILDKIKGLLGNYEYFYDLDGNFCFQEIKNYLNTSQSTVEIQNLQKGDYTIDQRRTKSIYDFNENALVTSITKNPSYENVKNDYVVWGLRQSSEGQTFPIRYHLALDEKPTPILENGDNIEDWRNVLYREGQLSEPLGRSSNYYYPELKTAWPSLYDTTALQWIPDATAFPSEINYYLDFIDTNTSLNELNITNIGRRSIVVTNDKINCIFAPVIPNYIVINSDSYDTSALVSEAISQGADYVYISPTLYESIALGTNYNDAFSEVRNLLYQHTGYNTQISINTIPIYYLDVNTRISVFDSKSGINGDYIVGSISVPLSISETMSINALAALERV